MRAGVGKKGERFFGVLSFSDGFTKPLAFHCCSFDCLLSIPFGAVKHFAQPTGAKRHCREDCQPITILGKLDVKRADWRENGISENKGSEDSGVTCWPEAAPPCKHEHQ